MNKIIILGLFAAGIMFGTAHADQEAIIHTKYGNIVILLGTNANYTVANFVKLAKSGFYDGTVFHRIIPGFVIQGGDPNSIKGPRNTWGIGDAGYTIPAEFSSSLHFTKYTVGMARSQDVNSGSSQFFITLDATPNLNGKYTLFGEVISGQDVVDKIATLKTISGDQPEDADDARISTITISSYLPKPQINSENIPTTNSQIDSKITKAITTSPQNTSALSSNLINETATLHKEASKPHNNHTGPYETIHTTGGDIVIDLKMDPNIQVDPNLKLQYGGYYQEYDADKQHVIIANQFKQGIESGSYDNLIFKRVEYPFPSFIESGNYPKYGAYYFKDNLVYGISKDGIVMFSGDRIMKVVSGMDVLDKITPPLEQSQIIPHEKPQTVTTPSQPLTNTKSQERSNIFDMIVSVFHSLFHT